MKMANKCYKCETVCSFKEDRSGLNIFGYPCDLCGRTICQNCNKTQAQEIRVIPSSTRSMLHVCQECMSDIRNLPTFLKEVKALKESVSSLRAQVSKMDCSLKSKPINDKLDKIPLIEKEIRDIKQTINSKDARDSVSQNLAPKGDASKVIRDHLDSQNEQISRKLDAVVEAIKDTNAELVRSLTMNQSTSNLELIRLPSNGQVVTSGQSTTRMNRVNASSSQFIPIPSKVSQKACKSGNTGSTMEVDQRPSAGTQNKTGNSSKPLIIGTGKDCALISAGERRQWLYLGRCDPNTNENDVINYISNNLEITDVKCFPLDRNDDVCSFKIGVKESLIKGLLEPGLWPEGTAVKEFLPRPQRKGYANFHRIDNSTQNQ